MAITTNSSISVNPRFSFAFINHCQNALPFPSTYSTRAAVSIALAKDFALCLSRQVGIAPLFCSAQVQEEHSAVQSGYVQRAHPPSESISHWLGGEGFLSPSVINWPQQVVAEPRGSLDLAEDSAERGSEAIWWLASADAARAPRSQ